MTDKPDAQDWVGRTTEVEDVLDLRPAHLMRSILPTVAPIETGGALPPLWHWLYFCEAVPLDQLGGDGHPARGGFLPPVDLPRRMWAGGRLAFLSDLRVGETVRRRSRILKVTPKAGASGPLCFVTVGHELAVDGDVRLREEQDIVYRGDPPPGAPTPAPPDAPTGAEATETVRPGPEMLFRYSALTFNAHRIHYDRDYCRAVEGYPGLVVHGPLTATLLADLAARRAGRRLRAFTFRAASPLYDVAPFRIRASGADPVSLWAETPAGGLAMTATADMG